MDGKPDLPELLAQATDDELLAWAAAPRDLDGRDGAGTGLTVDRITALLHHGPRARGIPPGVPMTLLDVEGSFPQMTDDRFVALLRGLVAWNAAHADEYGLDPGLIEEMRQDLERYEAAHPGAR